MKIGISYYIFSFILLFSLSSCDRIKQKQKHPQSLMSADKSAYTDERGISRYGDSLDILVPEYEKKQSMIYTLGDYSFYITAYLNNGEPLLYIENGESNQYGHITKHYYLHKGKVILFKENHHNESIDFAYQSEREYFRNNVLFYAESKKGSNSSDFNAAPYNPVKGVTRDLDSTVSFMTDALKREGKFNLVLEGITEDSRVRYIVLSRPGLGTYRTVIRVEKEDEFIRELVSNTEKFIGDKLHLNFDIIDNEAVYKSGSIN
ncbi:hypothetical protein [Arcticibacter eurypsychrophilus]|uniref:hypothetical protein n=1 Tax=Arcticibacter eurypsychrophilus TaxID=1434752 RepID=UPI001112CCAA|nr:hypothetical protein [Arcticibacter eurypsychrophilus]